MTITRQQKRAEIRALAKQIKKMEKAGILPRQKKTLVERVKGFFKGSNGNNLRSE